jgi:hypothetical protein
VLEDKIRKQIDIEQQTLGKKFNADERQKVIDRMLIKGEVDTGGLYSPNKTFYEVVGTPDEAKFVPFIPKDERAKIVEALQRNGKPVNDKEILNLYKKKQGIK